MNDISAFKRALVVAAHPDDEVLGCGGTICRLVSSNREVHVLLLGGVTTSRYKQNPDEESWEEESFQREAEKAAAVLGITSLTRSNFDDNRFDSVPLFEIVKAVEKLKNEIKPDLVLTHDYSDLNVDHRLTHQAALTAFRPDPKKYKFRIMAFETLSSTEWQDQAAAVFRPSCYVDISEFLSKKRAAMKCYKSELRDPPHPRSLEAIESLARKRGFEACVQAAEAFRIIREIC